MAPVALLVTPKTPSVPEVSQAELHVINRAFKAAIFRLAAPDDYPGSKADELSNALHHLHRLGELGRRTFPALGDRPVAVGAPGALGAQWIRQYDTHQIAQLATASVMTRRYLRSYGLVWRHLADMPFIAAADTGYAQDYSDHLAGEDVVRTMSGCFDDLERIVAELLHG